MTGNYYKFITQWRIKAPLIDVWYAIYNSEEWPLWWQGVEDVTVIRENDVDGINGIKKYTWKSILPYTLSFKMRLVKKHDFEFLSGVAFGELEGDGTWYFTEENGVTKVRYFWNVKTNRAWMNNRFYSKAFVQIKS
jgi:hypothetical protein